MIFWGVTGKSLIDVWTLAHFCFWVWMGSNFWAFGLTEAKAILIGLVIAIAWEIFEIPAELRWPHVWRHPESFWNRWVSDLATAPLGIGFMYWVMGRWNR